MRASISSTCSHRSSTFSCVRPWPRSPSRLDTLVTNHKMTGAMMLRSLVSVFLIGVGLAATCAQANEAEIRKAMQARFPGVTVDSVTKTPFPGIFEVVVGGRVLYTDEKTNYVFIGTLL